ncbi:Ig-like domain-containing protein [Maribacter sp. 2-571]|uniref:Ig-like domain-containing protein n=1 Tax=Maribacter sp. 2-571 TaxID=3417569 RepID=UPI003D336B47
MKPFAKETNISLLKVLFAFCLIYSCTKNVTLFTEVEFEVLTQYDDEGFINQPLASGFTVVPEEIMEDYTYSFSYRLESGEGVFLKPDGEILPPNTGLPLDNLSLSLDFMGTSEGEQQVVITVTDSFGFSVSSELTYTLSEIPITWTASGTAVQVAVNEPTAITVVLNTENTAPELVYEYRYTIISGEGTLTSEEGSAIPQNEFEAIVPGSYTLNFTPSALGETILSFVVRDNNGQETTVEVTFEVLAEVTDELAPELELNGANPQNIALNGPYQELGATAVDEVDGDLTTSITIDATEVDTSTEGTYEVRYSVSDNAGNTAIEIRIINVADNAVNEAPTAVNDERTTDTNTASQLDPTLNDIDPENDVLSVVSVGTIAPENAGTVTQNGNTLTFTPATDFTGTATFEYTINDGTVGNDATGTISIEVMTNVISVTFITVNGPTTLQAGTNETFTADVDPDNATDQSVTWSSSNTAVALVDENGLVTAVAEGTVNIVATANDGSEVSGAKELTVTDSYVPATSVVFDSPNDVLVLGATEQITVTILPADATPTAVDNWISSDNNIATVDNNGLVTAVGPGTVDITGIVENGSADPGDWVGGGKSFTITGIPVTFITVNGPTTLQAGTNETFTADVDPDNATDQTVTWSSSDTNIATVDADTGLVTAVSPGNANIRATANDQSGVFGSLGITVTGIPVTFITVNGPTTLQAGTNETFTADVDPGNATDQSVTWSSSDTNIATVDADTGLVTAVSPGNANIRATANDQSGVFGSLGITVASANQAPIAQGDLLRVLSNTVTSINVLSNDNDPDNDTISIISETNPTLGSISRTDDGFEYTPDGSCTNTSFTYTISDGNGGEATATVMVEKGGTTIGNNQTISPNLPSISGTITIYCESSSFTVSAFGGSGSSSVTFNIDGDSTSVTANAGQAVTNESDDYGPGVYNYTLSGSFNGSSGNSGFVTVTNN